MEEHTETGSPTLPPDAVLNIRGWFNDDEAEVRRFGEKLMGLTQGYSTYLDLSLLRQIVVAWDYPTALAEIASVEDKPPVTPTANEFGEGYAMAVWTRNSDKLGAALVIQTGLVASIFDDDSLEQRASLQTYVHELIHIDDKCFLDNTFPGGALETTARDAKHSALLRLTDGAYKEYSATRRTAFLEPTTGLHFLEMLEDVLQNLAPQLLERRQQYQRKTIDLEEFWTWASERVRFVFQSLGYALGHYDAVLANDLGDEDLRRQFEEGMTPITAGEFGWLVDETRAGILPVFDQAAWQSLDVLDPLNATAEKLLGDFGLFLEDREEQLWVDVPFRGLIDL